MPLERLSDRESDQVHRARLPMTLGALSASPFVRLRSVGLACAVGSFALLKAHLCRRSSFSSSSSSAMSENPAAPVDDSNNHYVGFPCERRETKDRGRIMVATRDIAAGEVVLRSMAYNLTVCDDFKTTVCSTCYKHTGQKLPACCDECREVFFCGDACKAAAEHFPIECAALRRLHSKENHFCDDSNSEIRMIVKVLAKKFQERAGSPPHEQMSKLLNTSDEGLALVKKPTYEDYLRLVPNTQNYNAETQLEVKKMTRYVCKIMPHREGELDEEEIFGLFFREKCNCFGIWDYKDRCLGSAVFPSASFFNHSCIPNCTRYADQTGLISVRTLFPVPEGEELCISYITLHDMSTEARMEQLRYYYCFECGCPRCADTSGASDEYMDKFLCKRTGCTGLLLPLEVGTERTTRVCRVCPYVEKDFDAATHLRHFDAPHYKHKRLTQ